MTLRDFKFPIILGLSFFAFNQTRRWLGIEFPEWFSAFSAVVVLILLAAFVYYGRKRERESEEYFARRDNRPKFDDEAVSSTIGDARDNK